MHAYAHGKCQGGRRCTLHIGIAVMVKVVARVAKAPTLLIKKIAAETAALLAAGAPILNLSQGSPNLPMFEVRPSASPGWGVMVGL